MRFGAGFSGLAAQVGKPSSVGVASDALAAHSPPQAAFLLFISDPSGRAVQRGPGVSRPHSSARALKVGGDKHLLCSTGGLFCSSAALVAAWK
jgi:hypothetical protein